MWGSGRGWGPYLSRLLQACAQTPAPPLRGRIHPPRSAKRGTPPASLPPAVPGCDHSGSTLTAVFLRPPLLMGRRDESQTARPRRSFFFFFFSCQESVWEKERDGQAAPPTAPGSVPPPSFHGQGRSHRGSGLPSGREAPAPPGASLPGAELRSPRLIHWCMQR